MTEGILRSGDATALIGPSGQWQSDDSELAALLQQLCPPPSTEVGTPWVIAFWRAVRTLRAAVIQEPNHE